jgi:hypothetical protein
MGQKVRRIREMIDLPVGEITAETTPLVVEIGAQVLVAGSAVYKGDTARCARSSGPEDAPPGGSRQLTTLLCILSRRKIRCRK